MRIIAKATKDIRRAMDKEFKILTRGIKAGTREAGEALKFSLRKQVRNAGMSRKFSNTWRAKHFENDGYNPAALVFSKAPEIARSFDEGTLITVNKRDWLAIPTKYAPKRIGKFRATPARLAKESRIKFRFVQTSPATAVLIAKSARRKKPVVMFVLVKRAKMPKKFDVEGAARKWAGKMPELIERELAKQVVKAENE